MTCGKEIVRWNGGHFYSVTAFDLAKGPPKPAAEGQGAARVTDEGINRKFDVVAEHLAQIAAAQLQYEARLGRLEESFTLLAKLASNLDARLGALTEAQTKTEARLAETNERLNAFITTVERYVTGNGKG